MQRLTLILCSTVSLALFVACGSSKPNASGTNPDGQQLAGEPRSAASGARAKWESFVERHRAKHNKAIDEKITKLKLVAAAQAQTPEAAKRIKTAEDNHRRAKIAFDDATQKGNAIKIKETKAYLEKTERELESAKSQHLDRLNSDIAAEEAKRSSFKEPRVRPTELQVGDAAKLGSEPGTTSVFVVFQIVDGQNALLKYGEDLFWGEFNTSGLADKDRVSLSGIVECTGTRQYTTSLGTTKTVRVLREY